MKTKSKIWDYIIAMIMVLLTIATACRKEEPQPEPLQIPKVTTEVTDISATSALCIGNNISCNNCWDWYNRGICYSNYNPQPTVSGSEIGGIFYDSCFFSMILDRLTPGTAYYVRAYITNAAGIGYGNIIEFSTVGSIIGDIQFNPDLTYGSLADIDGNTYKTITIGNQTWMAENLKTTKFNDGTDIPLIEAMNYWRGRSTPAYCWYLNDESKYKNPYGALYNWHTVNTGKLCPTGWHIPNWEEWTTLTSYLGGDSVAGGKLREYGIAHWIMTDEEVTNSSGFTALPGGSRGGLLDTHYPDADDFGNLGYSVSFWCTDSTPGMVVPYLGGTWEFCYDNYNSYCGAWASFMFDGLSVRCLKD